MEGRLAYLDNEREIIIFHEGFNPPVKVLSNEGLLDNV